jgi:hypothetical protein
MVEAANAEVSRSKRSVEDVCVTMEVRFPDSERYASSLGEIRSTLKPYIRNLEIRKRRNGVSISGPLEKLAAVALILPAKFEIEKWEHQNHERASK